MGEKREIAEWNEEYGRVCTKAETLGEYRQRLVSIMSMWVSKGLVGGLTFGSGCCESIRRLEEFLFYATGCSNEYELECEMKDYGEGWFDYFGNMFRNAEHCLVEGIKEVIEE